MSALFATCIGFEEALQRLAGRCRAVEAHCDVLSSTEELCAVSINPFCHTAAADSISFLLEEASYEEMEDLAPIMRPAYDLLPPEDRDDILLADILELTGLHWTYRGFFRLAEPLQRQAYEIKRDLDPFNPMELCWGENNIGNLLGSMGQYDECIQAQLRALRYRQISLTNENTGTKPLAVFLRNAGRPLLFAGRYLEAHIMCHMAKDIFMGSQNWAGLA